MAAGVTATLTGGSLLPTAPAYFATYGNILVDDGNTIASGITLNLSNLPGHTAVDLNFLAVFVNSWDSSNGSPAPDLYNVWIDGVQVASFTVNNASGTVVDIGGGTMVAQYVQFDTSVFFSDTAVDMSTHGAFSFAHSAPTLTVNILAGGSGWQPMPDEGYGVDNIQVVLTPVPEPGTLAMLAGGLALVGAVARRRRA